MQMQSNLPLSTTRVMRSVELDACSLTQISGTKIHGPPDDWTGPPPSTSCELLIYRIPHNVCAYSLLQLCMQFGNIYSFRVPIYTGRFNGIRGFAYVRYTNEQDAECAMTVLNHCFIAPKRLLNVVNSCEECTLRVKNIPRHLEEEEIERGLRTIFPTMTRIFSYDPSTPSYSSGQGNIGNVFVVFENHEDALEAKRRTWPGTIRLWEVNVKVFWAAREGAGIPTFNKTLFFLNANIHLHNNELYNLIVQYVDCTTISKMSVDRGNSLVEFTSRQAAEAVLRRMNGVAIGDSQLMAKWAKRPIRQRMWEERNTDFEALLRLKCLANTWRKPITIFGTFNEATEIQYGAVLLRKDDFSFRLIIVILQCSELVDIQSRLCEVVVTLIDTTGTFPESNFVFCAERNAAHLLGVVIFDPHPLFVSSHVVPEKFTIDLIEVVDISRSGAYLSEFQEEFVLQIYENSCSANEIHPYPKEWILGHRLIGAILPNYRKKPPLTHNLDNTQIVLALCYLRNGRNFSVTAQRQYVASQFKSREILLPYAKMPLSVSQYDLATNGEHRHCSAALLSIYPLEQAITPRSVPKMISKTGATIPVNEMIIADTLWEL